MHTQSQFNIPVELQKQHCVQEGGEDVMGFARILKRLIMYMMLVASILQEVLLSSQTHPHILSWKFGKSRLTKRLWKALKR